MTERLLLDTHIALWLDTGDPKLRPATRALIDEVWLAGGTILVSAVTAWEIAILADTGRITLDRTPEAWMDRFLGRAGVEGLALDWRVAARAYALQHLDHRDPADRLLMATAIAQNCPLVTYDTRMTAFAGGHGRQYGLRVAS